VPSTFSSFILQITRTGGIANMIWASVPGRTYQVEYADHLGGPWISLNPPKTAGPGEIALSEADSSSLPSRFYRVRLVSP
jgi:hypothetical protein